MWKEMKQHHLDSGLHSVHIFYHCLYCLSVPPELVCLEQRWGVTRDNNRQEAPRVHTSTCSIRARCSGQLRVVCLLMIYWVAMAFYLGVSKRGRLEAQWVSPVGSRFSFHPYLLPHEPHVYLVHYKYLLFTLAFHLFLSSFTHIYCTYRIIVWHEQGHIT